MNFHGGDIYKYNNGDILDFSSNINPMGVPLSFAKALQERMHEFTRYPDINYTSLRQSIANYLGIGNIDSIIPGNGAVELIYRLAEALPCRRVLTASPTFSEYGRAAVQNGSKLIEIPAFDREFQKLDVDMLTDNAEAGSLVIICNPNNPTGTFTGKSTLCSLTEKLAEKGCWLAIDEAFIEFTDGYPSNSMTAETARYDNLIVVRAVTKFFGMPGIRLGYAVCGSRSIADSIAARLEPWNVNTAAVIAADTVLQDEEYIARTRRWLSKERDYLYRGLESIVGIHVYRSAANFHLCKIEKDNLDAWTLKALMAEKGVLIRTPDGFSNLTPQHMRLAVKDREANDILLNVLNEVV